MEKGAAQPVVIAIIVILVAILVGFFVRNKPNKVYNTQPVQSSQSNNLGGGSAKGEKITSPSDLGKGT